ncbi:MULTISPECIES: hypothetical protein [Pseudomonas]|nr:MULTISPECIES: hypothetical protein [Pseudomonas]MDG9891291.1 hypothetical protein [Pseudomonas juntendi]
MSESFQLEWREGCVLRDIQVAHMKLYASRAFWLEAYHAAAQH